MHPSSKNLIFHIANEVCKQSPDTPKQAETNRTNRADPQMLVPFKTPKKLGLNIAVYHIKCKKRYSFTTSVSILRFPGLGDDIFTDFPPQYLFT